jgi:L-alanine-DL-glutamate epimerase-like enolase superfamily enzyme
MQITEIRTTPLLVPYSKPYYWAQGVIDGACVILIEVHTDKGIVGYGESIGSPSAAAIEAYLKLAAELCIGRDPFSNARLMADAYQGLFQAFGTCSSPRFSGQVLCGLEMALWDVVGKATGRPVHDLLGGAVRDEVRYFGFAQGENAAEVAADAGQLAREGFEVIYFKAGRGDALDLETASAIRAAIGRQKRLRVDANERWTPEHASRMIRALVAFGVEVVEQPTHCESVAALAQVRANSPISISADQSVFTPFEAFEVCRQRAADLVVVGLHETGGLVRFSKVAHIVEAAGLNICLHGLYETGITTCASNQIAATIPNLDDANQHMTRFLAWDIVKSPDLSPHNGRLGILKGPGLGFEIDWSGVERAKRSFASKEAGLTRPKAPRRDHESA